MVSTPTTKSGTKPTKRSRMVVLHLSAEALAKYPSDSQVTSKSSSKSSKSSSPNEDPSVPTTTPTINAPLAEKTPESADSPAPNATTDVPDDGNTLAPPATTKRKGVPGPKPGSKRSAAASEGAAKPRGKPGPKKKPRLADGTIDRSGDPSMPTTTTITTTTTKKGPFGGVAPITAHKLGPKANTGAINAGLRALDRSGKPCRKWERKGFTMKSITGVAWTVGSWSAPLKNQTFSGDVKSESSGSSENKANLESSAVPSERSVSALDGYGAGQSQALESSPAPVATPVGS